MKFRIFASLLVVAVLLALANLSFAPQSSPTPVSAPSADDASLKSLRIE